MGSRIVVATIAASLIFPAVSGSAPRTLGNGCCDQIWSITPAGKQRKQLLFNTIERQWLVFDLSPDRRRIVFWACIRPSEYCVDGSLFTASVSGQHTRAIVMHVGVTAAQWSPDGKRILFAKNATYCCPGPTQLAVVSANGTGLRTVVTCAFCDTGVWAPDSRRIAYVESVESAGPSPEFFLKVKDVSATQNRVVAQVQGNGIDLSWSPGGRWLAYYEISKPARGRVLRVVRLDGKRNHTVGNLAEAATPYAWSPDGRRLAFVGPRGLTIANLDGSHRRLLDRYRPFGASCCGPAWSPNGREIAYFRSTSSTSVDERGNLTLIAPNARARRKLTQTFYTDKIFWARDGRRIYYAAR